eukprot:snap_masked-scaffold_4-processed-gene-20.9-mRNA-1 protein AED:1.00 eAED:1.00 QI:0/-1/0/0/-1/1/1/0/173
MNDEEEIPLLKETEYNRFPAQTLPIPYICLPPAQSKNNISFSYSRLFWLAFKGFLVGIIVFQVSFLLFLEEGLLKIEKDKDRAFFNIFISLIFYISVFARTFLGELFEFVLTYTRRLLHPLFLQIAEYAFVRRKIIYYTLGYLLLFSLLLIIFFNYELPPVNEFNKTLFKFHT